MIVPDARPQDEFAQGHLPGARNIPFPELGRRLNEQPKAAEIVAYCPGSCCVFAAETVTALRAHGFKAMGLEAMGLDDGFPEWKAIGLAVESTGRK